MHRFFLYALAAFLLTTSLAQAAYDEAACFRDGKTCSDADIDLPRAPEAFRRGCDAEEIQYNAECIRKKCPSRDEEF
jgi:hypothetical protein